MTSKETVLSTEHQLLARDLWEALNNAPNPTELKEARARLAAAPEEVRSAILRANIARWREGTEPLWHNNPFEE
jgi:hypothetical protein